MVYFGVNHCLHKGILFRFSPIDMLPLNRCARYTIYRTDFQEFSASAWAGAVHRRDRAKGQRNGCLGIVNDTRDALVFRHLPESAVQFRASSICQHADRNGRTRAKFSHLSSSLIFA